MASYEPIDGHSVTADKKGNAYGPLNPMPAWLALAMTRRDLEARYGTITGERVLGSSIYYTFKNGMVREHDMPVGSKKSI